MTFAERLRKYREKAGYSQKALSEKIGLTPNAYNKIEKSETDEGEPAYHFLYEEWEVFGTLPMILENFKIVQNYKNTHIEAIIKSDKARHFMAAMEFSNIE